MNINLGQLINTFKDALGQEMNPQAMVMRAIQTTGNNMNPMIGNLVKMAQSGQLEQLMTFAQNFMQENNIDPNQLVSQLSNAQNSNELKSDFRNLKL